MVDANNLLLLAILLVMLLVATSEFEHLKEIRNLLRIVAGDDIKKSVTVSSGTTDSGTISTTIDDDFTAGFGIIGTTDLGTYSTNVDMTTKPVKKNKPRKRKK